MQNTLSGESHTLVFPAKLLKHCIRNDGLMSFGAEMPIHEAIVFDLELPALMDFRRITQPVYYSFSISLLIACWFYLSLLMGEGISCSSNPVEILPRLSPLK